MDLNLSLDQKSDIPLHIQVFNEVRDLILTGHLKPGVPLPSSRALAEQMLVSRNTVILGYDRLSAEGYIESRGTAGTFVSSSLPDDLLKVSNVPDVRRILPVDPEPVLCFAGTPGGHGASSRPKIDFWVGRSAAESFPLRVWRKLIVQTLNAPELHIADYSDPAGLIELRQAISEHLARARGMATSPEQIAITGGSQDGLNFVLRLTHQSFKRVFVENPCYQGAAHLFKSVGLEVVPIPVDHAGLCVDKLPRTRSSLVFVTPSHQFPTGATLSLERRFQLNEWAERYDSFIIEDDYDSDFRYDGPPLTALAGLDESRRVFYLGTFSKSLGAGLRIGYTAVPSSLQGDIRQVRAFMSNGQPWLEQVVLSEFLKNGEFNRHLRRVRKIYKERRDTLIECLAEYFPETAVHGSESGLHVIWTLPNGFPTATELQTLARSKDIGVYSLKCGAAVDFDKKSADDTLLLGYSSVEPTQIRKAIKILRSVCDGGVPITKSRTAAQSTMSNVKTNSDTPLPIAAISRTDTCDVDELLRDVALDLQKKGYRVGGAIRTNKRRAEAHPCDVILEDLRSGETISLSQTHGPEARGCLLDPAALARVAGLVDASLENGLDLLIINKFGKRETEGSGLVDTIARAVEIGIPVVVSVSEDHADAWHTFCGGHGLLLAPQRDAIDQWLNEKLRDIR